MPLPLIVFAIAATIYMLPSLVAVWLRGRQQWAILALNLMLGWTIVGWVAALMWACRKFPKPRSPKKRSAGDRSAGGLSANSRSATLRALWAATVQHGRARRPEPTTSLGEAGGPANDNAAAESARMAMMGHDGEAPVPDSGDAYAEWLESGECLPKPATGLRGPAPRSAA